MASVPASYSNVHVNKQNKNMSFLQFCYIKLHPVENFLAYHIPPLSCDYHLYSFFPALFVTGTFFLKRSLGPLPLRYSGV